MSWAMLIVVCIITFVLGWGSDKLKRYIASHKKGWVNVWSEYSALELHTIPQNDLEDHARVDNCICNPKVIAIPRDDGSVAWQIIHNAWDGRE